jgi:hypothetical protein
MAASRNGAGRRRRIVPVERVARMRIQGVRRRHGLDAPETGIAKRNSPFRRIGLLARDLNAWRRLRVIFSRERGADCRAAIRGRAVHAPGRSVTIRIDYPAPTLLYVGAGTAIP